MCPRPRVTPYPQITYFGTLRPPFVSLVRVKLTTSKSVYLFNTANTSQPMTCCPQVRRGQGHVTISDFSKKWQYLKNCTRYNGRLIGHRMQPIEWWHCGWPWVTRNPQNDLLWYILAPFASLATIKLDTSNLVHVLIMAGHDGASPGSRDPWNFSKMVAISRKRFKIATQ